MNEVGVAQYVFALFVFVLAASLIFLFVKLLGGSRKKVDERLLEREQRMERLFNNIQESLEAAEQYIEESKRDIAVERERINNALEEVNLLKLELEMRPMEIEHTEPIVEIEEEPQKLPMRSEVSKLAQEGYSVSEIARKLGYSKTEVSLMLRFTGTNEG